MRPALTVLGLCALLASAALPAVTMSNTTLSGAALVIDAMAARRFGSVAFLANVIVPGLALLRPRLRRIEILLVTLVLAAAAWLTARALSGPVQLHAGVALWWLSMLVLGGLALQARSPQAIKNGDPR